ncbi:MAG: Fic/DOC family protein, partial [Rhizobacter sp.]|nr:Fic/DOC family protein [Rhizobacter sp.]
QADAGEMLRLVLDAGATTVAGRFIGGLTAVRREDEADRLRRAMVAAGHEVRPVDPFQAPLHELGGSRTESPYAQRIRAMWAAMRPVVVAVFDKVEAGAPLDPHQLMRDVQERYVADAYNSLSIEGYDVDETLIERVRSGGWSPDLSADDKKSRDALAAKGYAEAFGQVLEAVGSTVAGRLEAATVLGRLLPDWHLALFSSSVRAGIIKASDLAGFRNKAVFISNAQHVPPPHEALRDCMPALMELLQAEEHGAVRAVLGHFVFVFIHPYIDGNGRLGRFIMNFMLTTAGYVWTIVPVARRTEYMDALAAASSGQNIRPFAEFTASLVSQQTRRPMTRTR